MQKKWTLTRRFATERRARSARTLFGSPSETYAHYVRNRCGHNDVIIAYLNQCVQFHNLVILLLHLTRQVLLLGLILFGLFSRNPQKPNLIFEVFDLLGLGLNLVGQGLSMIIFLF